MTHNQSKQSLHHSRNKAIHNSARRKHSVATDYDSEAEQLKKNFLISISKPHKTLEVKNENSSIKIKQLLNINDEDGQPIKE